MASESSHPAAPLFDRTADGRAFVPTKLPTGRARGGGQGRPSGRRARALPLRAASPPPRWVSIGIVTLVLGLAGPGRAQPILGADNLQEIVLEAASRFALPPNWIAAVMRVESAGQMRAISPKGALGLMQVMPRTYEGLRLRYGLGADPFQPRDNILAGSAYLRELLDRYGRAGMLAAYNAGPARYEDFLEGRRPLPSETQAYVAALAPVLAPTSEIDAAARPSTPLRPSLFVTLTTARSMAGGDGSSSATGLFVRPSSPESRP